jgi:hypothetical protein
MFPEEEEFRMHADEMKEQDDSKAYHREKLDRVDEW